MYHIMYHTKQDHMLYILQQFMTHPVNHVSKIHKITKVVAINKTSFKTDMTQNNTRN